MLQRVRSADRMKKAKSDYAIQTVVNALRVLEAFEDHDELGVTEIARALDLHKNNAFRLLATASSDSSVLETLAYTPPPDKYVKFINLGWRDAKTLRERIYRRFN